MSIFSYLFENNRHQATFSTLPVVVGSNYTKIKLKCASFGLEDWRVARNQNGAFICRRNLHQAQPRILHGLRLVWGAWITFGAPPSPTLATSLVVLVLLFLSWSCKQRSWLFWCWSWSCYFGLVYITDTPVPRRPGRSVPIRFCTPTYANKV